MGQYGIFIHNQDGRGIPRQSILHRQDVCARRNNTCADARPEERTITSQDGLATIYLNDQRPNHWFYWDPAHPETSGANSSHHDVDPSNQFWADIEM